MFRVLLLLTLAGALAEEPCACGQVTDDVEDLRKFLTNPEKYNNVLPGELSPYICSCGRQRRSEDLKVPLKVVEVSRETPSTPKICARRKQEEIGLYRCASGFYRKGVFCVVDPCFGSKP